MGGHTRLAVAVAVVLVTAGVLVDGLAWHLATSALVLPAVALALDRVRWTPLARVRVVQLGAIGQIVTVAGLLTNAPNPVTVAGWVVTALAVVVTGFGVKKFRKPGSWVRPTRG